jgi:hypothetical protein
LGENARAHDDFDKAIELDITANGKPTNAKFFHSKGKKKLLK